MKSTLEFELPEDHIEYRLAVNGPKMATVIWDILQGVRDMLHYHNHKNRVHLDKDTLVRVGTMIDATLATQGISEEDIR